MTFAKHVKKEQAVQSNSRQMAEWLFDHGYGRVDEPSFMIGKVVFYAHDFADNEQSRTLLKNKIWILEQVIEQFGDKNFSFTFGKNWQKNNNFDLDKIRSFGFEETKRGLIAQGGELSPLIDQLKSEKPPFFKDDIGDREQQMRRSDRAYFVKAFESVNPIALKHAVLRKAHIHLNAFYYDEFDRTRNEGNLTQFGSHTDYFAGFHEDLLDGAKVQGPMMVVVGGVSDHENWQHVFYHEMGHDFFTSAANDGNDDETAKSKLNRLAGYFAINSPPKEIQAPNYLTYKGSSTYDNIPSKGFYVFFEPPPKSYGTPQKQANEILCHALGLALGPLSSQKSQEAFREHYREAPEFAEAVLELCNETASFYRQKIKALEVEHPPPEELTTHISR